ncbi:MAG: cupin domain-containing protein [Kofleriaceae bacterium]
MRALVATSLLALAGCSGTEATRAAAPPHATSLPPSAVEHGAAPPVDAPPASEEERLAAIQKAMNELDEAAQRCWALAAVERFDIEGELVATIDIAPGAATVAFARDTARNPVLATCLSQLLAGYRWAPPLYGQAIQLPFRFRAPDGQSVIDRAMVPWHGQASVSVAVLLDENNTGNAALSMFELALDAGATTRPRRAERAELWYFLGPASVAGTGDVAAGDMMYVAPGAVREVQATHGPVHAVIAMSPGGREGSARAGALPTREATAGKAPGPTVLRAAAARVYPQPIGQVRLFADPSTIRDRAMSGGTLELPSGGGIPAHVHASETEAVYVLAGAGTLTIDGVTLPIAPSSVIQIPAGARHAFTATADLRAVQFYTPAGPEQRFKRPPTQARP